KLQLKKIQELKIKHQYQRAEIITIITITTETSNNSDVEFDDEFSNNKSSNVIIDVVEASN
ncbi:7744_t:CDS:1, partial [Ambispora gerdemannii]